MQVGVTARACQLLRERSTLDAEMLERSTCKRSTLAPSQACWKASEAYLPPIGEWTPPSRSGASWNRLGVALMARCLAHTAHMIAGIASGGCRARTFPFSLRSSSGGSFKACKLAAKSSRSCFAEHASTALVCHASCLPDQPLVPGGMMFVVGCRFCRSA